MRKVALMMALGFGVIGCADGRVPPQPVSQPPAITPPPPTAVDIGSANEVMRGCRAFIARTGDTAYMQGICAGKVEGVWSFATGICSPSEATMGQAIRVVARYIDERPARLHENFMILARDAMRESWPCRR
jgi:hypothetical protein